MSFGTKFISATVNALGNWGWLDLDRTGGSTLETNIENGASGSFTIGQYVGTKPGKTKGPINKSISNRLAGCPSIADPCGTGFNPTDIPAGDPCLVIVPVVDFTSAHGSSTDVQIEAFAQIYLDPTQTIKDVTINGCFVRAVVGNTIAGSPVPKAVGPLSPPTLSQ